MRLTAFLVSCALVLTSSAMARDIVPAERRVGPWTGIIPGCDDPSVLSRIAWKFASREATYEASSLGILGYSKIRTLAYRPWGLDYIPRRFCTGVALISDGKKRRINYVIREDLGIIGATWGVEWCLIGLDINWAYVPRCRLALPNGAARYAPR